MIYNIYAPCENKEKGLLWERLKLSLNNVGDGCVCCVGDFNAICVEGERMGSRPNSHKKEIRDFANFINGAGLIDLPINGKPFTWSNGRSRSRIDRALINEKWLEAWPDSQLKGLDKGTSDHCPIVVETLRIDWGPKPFKYIMAWESNPSFYDFVVNKWKAYDVNGWAGYILKEKIKMLKEDLKIWNGEVFGWIDREISMKMEKIKVLDAIDDTFGLSEDEMIERNKLRARLCKDYSNKNSLLWQKFKCKWVIDGDVNSAFFII